MLLKSGTSRIVETPKRYFLIVGLLLSLLLYLSSINSEKWTLPMLHQSSNESSQSTSTDILPPFKYPNGVFDDTSEGAAIISQVSMQFGDHFDVVSERALRTHIEHGQKWGYPTHYLRQDIIGQHEDSQSESVYNKLLYLQTIMVNEMIKPFGRRSEWLVWFDADTVLTNDEIPWTTFLPPSTTIFQGIHLLVTTDENGFNAGVFLIRVCEWSIDLLADAIAFPRLHADVQLVFKEQDALRDRFNVEDRKNHRLYVPRHWFNPYDFKYLGRGKQVMDGTMLLHFPGLGHETRAEAMGLWLDKLDHTPEALKLPLANTSYPAETTAFWKQISFAMETQSQASRLKKDARDAQIPLAPNIFDALDKANGELSGAIQEEAFEEEKIGALAEDLQRMVTDIKEEIRRTDREDSNHE